MERHDDHQEMFTIIGTVPDFNGVEFMMPAENSREFGDWLQANRIDTRVQLVDGKPSVKLRGSFAASCRPGQKIRYTIRRFDRRDGRRIYGEKVEPF